MTNSWNTPIEAFEQNFPVRIRAYAIRRGSGGAGRQRGGDGIVREYEFLEDADVTLLSDRQRFRPYGLAGGCAGEAGRALSRRGRKQTPLEAKSHCAVQPGDVLRIETPGGGGWGTAAKVADKR